MNTIYSFSDEENSIINYYRNILVIKKGNYRRCRIVKIKKELFLYAPSSFSENTINACILKNHEEIAKKAYFCYSFANRYTLYNDKILYLGRYYDFILKPAFNKYNKIDNDNLIIYSGINLLNKNNLEQFYKEQCNHIFPSRVYMYSEQNHIKISNVKAVKYKSVWGCCTYSKGIIKLNTKLILAPVGTIDSVICHELAHIKHPDHSKEFYNYLTSIYPEYYKDHLWLNYFMPV